MAKKVGMEFAFFEFLRSFYVDNRGIIRNRYREIRNIWITMTRKRTQMHFYEPHSLKP